MNKLSEDNIGLLPHEFVHIESAIDDAKMDLRKSNLAYGDAVASSGGDWAFDDAGSQAAAQEAHQREKKLSHLMGIIAKMGSTQKEILYPDNSIDYITHGSYIELELNGKSRSFFVGTHRLPGLEVIDGVEVISSDSPIGSVLIGRKEGETIEWQLPNGRKMNAIVKIIDQERMKGFYER